MVESSDFAEAEVRFEEDGPVFHTPPAREEFLLGLESYEGPLDLLLEMARKHKVDLRAVSVLQLAEQYLAFIARARQLEVQLAADYLAMAAWLAYLKSCLLLPKDEEERADADELAALLAARLERLEAMRRMGRLLFERPRLHREVFARGMPQASVVRREHVLQASLVELLGAYARVRTHDSYAPLHLQRPPVIAAEEALARLREMLPGTSGWLPLTEFLPEGWRRQELLRSAIGSLLLGALELTRIGDLEIEQERAFAPVQLRRRTRREEGAGHVAAAG